MHACTHACRRTYVYTFIRAYMHTCTKTSVHTCRCESACMYTYNCTFMYVRQNVCNSMQKYRTHTERHVYSFFVHPASALTHAAASSPGCEGLAGSSHCIGQVKVAASGRTTGSIASTCRHQYRLLRHRGMAQSITLTVTITRHRKTHDTPKTVVVITAIVRTSLLAASRSLYRSIQKTMAQ